MDEVSNDRLTEAVIAAAIEVHRIVGPGLLESAYGECLAREFSLRGIRYVREQPLFIVYKGAKLDTPGYRLDFLVEDQLAVELKSQERLAPVQFPASELRSTRKP